MTDDVLFDLVESRLARESPQMRLNLEKFSLLKNVPLAVAIQGLGSDAVTALEEHGFMAIASDHSRTVSFAEPFVGETVRNQLSPSKKADYFREFSGNLSFDVAAVSPQEVLTFASWMNEAGLVMEPDLAVAAAQTALQLSDPHLALACARLVPPDHPLAVQAAQKRSRAHYLMADYSKAAEVLEAVETSVLETLSAADYAAWSMDLATALVWLPGTRNRVDESIEAAALRVEQASGDDRMEAEKFYNVARFEVHANRGEFSQVLEDLKIASKYRHDRVYRLNCCCLLTMALTATGQELEAIKLSQEILEEAERFDVVLRMQGWQMYGSILAHIWSGQWSRCEKILQHGIDYSNSALHYQGGVIELALGVLYAFAGRDMEAAEILLVAAAQLEVRNTYTSSEMVYSALACVFARLEDQDQARRYLQLAKDFGPQGMWVNRTLSDYFQALAAHALGDPTAIARLTATAEQDLSAGRPAPAANGLRAAVFCGGSGLEERLEEAAQSCQGELAALSIGLARAKRVPGDAAPRMALDVATQAHGRELVDLERYATELALELATTTGDKRLQREAKTGLRGLEWADEQKNAQGPGVVALTPRELQVARQAIRGMSNRDIAKKIGVSVRTVEGHLYQVFAKLGITSRTELEKWVNL
ncbi:helix-turn-helix transcriptional regulator [Arthrobacter psychrolactophilus]